MSNAPNNDLTLTRQEQEKLRYSSRITGEQMMVVAYLRVREWLEKNPFAKESLEQFIKQEIEDHLRVADDYISLLDDKDSP